MIEGLLDHYLSGKTDYHPPTVVNCIETITFTDIGSAAVECYTFLFSSTSNHYSNIPCLRMLLSSPDVLSNRLSNKTQDGLFILTLIYYNNFTPYHRMASYYHSLGSSSPPHHHCPGSSSPAQHHCCGSRSPML